MGFLILFFHNNRLGMCVVQCVGGAGKQEGRTCGTGKEKEKRAKENPIQR